MGVEAGVDDVGHRLPVLAKECRHPELELAPVSLDHDIVRITRLEDALQAPWHVLELNALRAGEGSKFLRPSRAGQPVRGRDVLGEVAMEDRPRALCRHAVEELQVLGQQGRDLGVLPERREERLLLGRLGLRLQPGDRPDFDRRRQRVPRLDQQLQCGLDIEPVNEFGALLGAGLCLFASQALYVHGIDAAGQLLERPLSDRQVANIVKASVERAGLDPFTKQIHFIKYGNNAGTVVTGIDGYRAIAARTNEYDGQEGPFWCGEDGQWVDVWLGREAPLAAKVGVIRHDFKETCWAVARFDAYKQTFRDQKTSEMKREAMTDAPKRSSVM